MEKGTTLHWRHLNEERHIEITPDVEQMAEEPIPCGRATSTEDISSAGDKAETVKLFAVFSGGMVHQVNASGKRVIQWKKRLTTAPATAWV